MEKLTAKLCSISFPFRHLINAGEAEGAVDQRGEHTEPIPNLINIWFNMDNLPMIIYGEGDIRKRGCMITKIKLKTWDKLYFQLTVLRWLDT